MKNRKVFAPAPERPDWIRIGNVGKYVELGTTKIYDLLNRGLIRSARIGGTERKAGSRLINLPDLERFLAESATGGAEQDHSSSTPR
jgi:hypothetical protein